MGTRMKRHLIAGTIIGGLLLAATTQTGNSFALSDTSSASTGATPTTSQQTPTTSSTNTAPSGDATTTPPPTTATDTAATGSTAMQTANTTAGATTDTTNATTPATTDPATVPTANTQTNNTTATTKVNSAANTGGATVKHTTDGGNATTGNANGTATVVNSVGSTSNLNGGNLQTFNYNVDGTHNGNIVINPNDILSSANNPTPTTPADCLPTGSTKVDNNTTINNLITLLAKTGNAKVSDNGIGGNATSGNATTEANIVNMIQDLVSNKGAFLGVININGNLNGNIELPASAINSLLTPTQTSGAAPGNTTAVNNDNVNNNVTLTAMSGNATATNNGVGGNATSGNAQTILESCNLINSNIVGGNLLLVFVNVMGHWYGALLSEPAGNTTATLGGGITQDTQLPSQQVSVTNNATINNNIDLTSISGNATVANNGIGGNATTGNATAIADITNILGSQINLSGWLGILIINVFGTWNGGLVIQPTAAVAITPTTGGSNDQHNQNAVHHTAPVHLGNGAGYIITDPPQSFDAGQYDLTSTRVLGDSTTSPNSHVLVASSVKLPSATPMHNLQTAKRLTVDFILAGIGGAMAVSAGITRIFSNQRKKG